MVLLIAWLWLFLGMGVFIGFLLWSDILKAKNQAVTTAGGLICVLALIMINIV